MKKDFFIIFLGAIIPWVIYLIINDIIELANFIVTTLAFGAAIYAIYYQHQESKQAEKNFQTQLNETKKASAWQVLANKASGNSGKKEAIEFLASQGIPLCGIDMSAKTHGGEINISTKTQVIDMSAKIQIRYVYLDSLFKDFKKEDRSKIDLNSADFSGANLNSAIFDCSSLHNVNFSSVMLTGGGFANSYLIECNFSNSILVCADFKGTVLSLCNFSNSNLGYADFKDASLSEINFVNTGYLELIVFNKETFFFNCYCEKTNAIFRYDSKFAIDERTKENGEPIYPENNENYRYIKLIKLK